MVHMARIDDDTIAEVKLAQARQWQQLFAPDGYWDLMLQMYQASAWLLSKRQEWQPLAKRHKNSPLRFCEKTLGPEWFKLPQGASRRQVQALLKAAPDITRGLTSPQEISDSDGNSFLTFFRTLAARQPGRKPLGIYVRALALRQENPPWRFHKICQELNPKYSQMAPHQRRTERERIRSGVARLQGH